MLVEEISTAGPIHIYSRVLIKFHASHGTVQLEFTMDRSAAVNHDHL